MVTPYINDEKAKTEELALENFYKVLNYLENFQVKRVFGEIALKVIRDGCYYGYIVHTQTGPNIQELPSEYCR